MGIVLLLTIPFHMFFLKGNKMESFQSIKSDNKSLEMNQADVEQKISMFQQACDNVCKNIESNHVPIPIMFRKGHDLFRSLTSREKRLFGHWYNE